METPSRNGPCPCGSGKKFKKCCLPKEERALPSAPKTETEHFIVEQLPEVDAQVDRVLHQLELGAGSEAAAEVIALYKKYPRYHMTNYAMGVYKGTIEKDPEGAVPFFAAAVQIFPLFPEAHINLGSALLKSGHIGRAVTAYRRAERYCRNDDELAQKARERIQWIERMVRETSPFRSLDAYIANEKLFHQAYECLQNQQFEEAVELFKRVLDDYPDHVASYGNLGLAYAGLGNRREALACLDRALELDPEYNPALTNRDNIAQMREGEAFVPQAIMEVKHYKDRYRETHRG